MRVKELNALLNKLSKANQDQEVILTAPGPMGPIWLEPTVVQAKDGLYIVPKKVEDRLEAHMSREQVAEQMTKFHQEAQQQGGGSNA